MPSSAIESKQVLVDWFEEIKPRRVLDIGVGCGTYSMLLNGRYPVEGFRQYQGPKPYMVGIEVYYPYVTQFDLNAKYDKLVIGDARYFDYFKLWQEIGDEYDLTIMGDVLEHMTKDEAVHLFDEVKPDSYNLLISLPIIHYPQGAFDGNPFEVHVKENWTHEEVIETFGEPIKFWKGSIVGTYWYPGYIGPRG